MNTEWNCVSGVVVAGHCVASGPSDVYPYGSLVKQSPFFKALGLNLDSFYLGTINISISPKRWALIKPEYTFKQIAWTNLHPPEDFSFSACRITFHDHRYKGWVYYPHPETKIRHFQDPSLIEVITNRIMGLKLGNQVALEFKTKEISLED